MEKKTDDQGIKISEVSTYYTNDNRLMSIWATDLLSEEIEIDIEESICNFDSKRKVLFLSVNYF